MARAAKHVSAPWPGFIEPCLATLHVKPPGGAGWAHGIKHDGYRVQLQIREGAAVAFARRGHDWTHRFQTVAEPALKLPVRTCILDGEAVVPSSRAGHDRSAGVILESSRTWASHFAAGHGAT